MEHDEVWSSCSSGHKMASTELGDQECDGVARLLKQLESSCVPERLETLLVDADHAVALLRRNCQISPWTRLNILYLETAIDDSGHVPVDPIHVNPARGATNFDPKPTLRVSPHHHRPDSPLRLPGFRLHRVEPLQQGHWEALVHSLVVDGYFASSTQFIDDL